MPSAPLSPSPSRTRGGGAAATPRSPDAPPWFAPFSVDLIWTVLLRSVCHPFVACLIPLCLLAEMMEYDAMAMRVSIRFAILVSLSWLAEYLNRRLAYGASRAVDLGGEVIVVTGGSSGLGMLLAEVYGMRGVSVAVVDAVGMENPDSRGVHFYKCDVGDKCQVERVAKTIERDLGRPTVVINNAAVVNGSTFLETEVEDIERAVRTNILGYFYTLKAFLPMMTGSPKGGTVVTVSSVIGSLGAARLTDYAASKAAVTALHKSLSLELAQTHPNIKMILVAPGQLTTSLFRGVATPNAFFAPLVDTARIAREIVGLVDRGDGGFIAFPLYARLVEWYHVLPAALQRFARYCGGVDSAMETFIGRDDIVRRRPKTS